MDKGIAYIIAAVVVVLVAVGAFAAVSGMRRHTATTSTAAYTSTIAQNGSTSFGMFNGSQYEPHAYMIYPGLSNSPSAQAVMSDFKESETTLQNGSALVVLDFPATKAVYNVTVPPGYSLYYVDRYFTDDSTHGDATGIDDSYVLVNPSGYITNVSASLTDA